MPDAPTFSALFQIAAAQPSTALIGGVVTSVTVSIGSLVTAASALMKLSRWQGRFEEFKANTQKEEDRRRTDELNVVKRHEITGLERHIDTRFDDLSRQIGELRSMQSNQ